jgi:hypothetical protein
MSVQLGKILKGLDQQDVLQEFPELHDANKMAMLSDNDKKRLQICIESVAEAMYDIIAHPDPVDEEDLYRLIQWADMLMKTFKKLQPVVECGKSIKKIEDTKEALEETLENPWTSKHDGETLYFHHCDANTIAEHAHGFTDDEDNDESLEGEDENYDSAVDSDSGDGSETGPAKKKCRVQQ